MTRTCSVSRYFCINYLATSSKPNFIIKSIFPEKKETNKKKKINKLIREVLLFGFINMLEAVWGGLLGGFGHTVFYPVNPNPPRATSTHLTHLYLTLPYHTRVVGGGGFEGGLGCFGMVWGVSMDRKIPIRRLGQTDPSWRALICNDCIWMIRSSSIAENL